MNAFQWLGLALAVFLIAWSVLGAIRRQGRRGAAAAWTLLWLVTALVLIRPEITVALARKLGIGRGADLVFYCAILATMAGSRHHEQQELQRVRHGQRHRDQPRRQNRSISQGWPGRAG